MRSMKSILALMSLGMMTSAMSKGSHFNDGSFGHGVPEQKPKVIPKGCSEYTFYGFTVTALNEKSARKKCIKLSNKKYGLTDKPLDYSVDQGGENG
jgi:hypothetical protein